MEKKSFMEQNNDVKKKKLLKIVVIIGTIIVIAIAGLLLLRGMEKKAVIEAWETSSDVMELENNYNITLEFSKMKLNTDDKELYGNIISEGFSKLGYDYSTMSEIFFELDKTYVTYDFMGKHKETNLSDGFKISSGGNTYAMKGKDYDKYCKLYCNDFKLYDIRNPKYHDNSYDDEKDYSDLKWEPTIGMTKSEVLDTTWGMPDDRNITSTEYGDVEQWIYDDLGWVYFTDGICDAIQYKDDLN